MISFQARNRARFSYHASFARADFANLSFYDRDRTAILFHLSLRRNEGLAVCNRRDGEQWGREVVRRLPLDARGVQVEIRFDPPRVTVALDGSEVFRFGGALRRGRFPDLDRIGYVDFQGGIQPGSIDIDSHGAAGPLTLDDRLELRGTLPDGADPATLALRVPGLDPAPQPIFGRTRPNRYRANLPGRAWAGVGAGEPLEIGLYSGRDALAHLTLTRDEMARTLARALTAGDLAGDIFAAMQVIEHARFSGLAGALPPDATAALNRLVSHYRLDGFLYPEGGPAPARVPAPGSDPEGPLHAALARVAPRIRNGDPPERWPDLPGDLPMLALALTEPACAQDGFDALRARIAPPAPPAADDIPWVLSGHLPWLYRAGDHDGLRAALARITPVPDWIMLSPLAWVVTRALSDPDLPTTERDRLLEGFEGFLDARRRDYWQRTSSIALIDAMAAILAQADHLPAPLAARMETAALRVYGLSRRFWEAVAALPAPSPRLTAARTAAERLLAPDAHADDPAALAQALAIFDRANNVDALRLRRELLGPAGMPGNTPDLAALMAAGLDPGQAGLRHMAFPGSAPVAPDVAPDMARAVQAALPACDRAVPIAPSSELMTRTVGQAQRLLAGDVTLSEPDIPPLAESLATLCRPALRGAGMGLGLGLLTGLCAQGRRGEAALLAGALRPLATPGQAALPAVAMTLTRLVAEPAPTRAQAPVADLLDALGPAPDAPAAAPDPRANPLFDTLVVIFSCRAHLDTRIPALRAAWADGLVAQGIPYVIVVGDGDGRREGDVVHLEAPDDYEGLPQKTLAAIRWVHDRTAFTHLYKIDDDCFLNAAAFLESYIWRRFDYYGRPLPRGLGQMDRAWHCTKSGSDRGRMELDKSPEPSLYADGGSGYTLSRTAMAAALAAADSPEGQHLRQVSFMEDKLLGDLLALAGIAPEGQGYRTTIRRRATPGGQAVPHWVNGFDASALNRVALVHLDDSAAQARAAATLPRPVLRPPRIWPGFQDAALGEHSNALEPVSAPGRLAAAREAPVSVVAVMRNEMFMLPHFLAHYRRLGVESFLIADNCSDDGTLEYLEAQPDVALFSVDTAYARGQYGVAWQQAMLGAFRVGRWSLMADADELLTWEPAPRTSLPDLLAGDAFAEADAVQLFMLDMYPQGPLAEADFSSGDPFAEAGFVDRDPFRTDSFGRGPFDDAPSWTSALRHRLIPGSRAQLFVAQKIALLRYHPAMRLSAGLHYVAETRPAERELLLAHFKYNADFRRKAQAEVTRRQHFNDAEEYRKYLALASEGREVIHDPAISVPWTACDWVRKRLKWD